MSQGWITAAALRIKSDSAAGRLTGVDIIEALEGEGEKETSLLLNQYPDVKVLPGKTREYFYDQTVMNQGYAEILLRVEEEDYPALIRETVEKESRLYPRTTAVNRFLESPFSVPEDLLPEAVNMVIHDDTNSIENCRASNGAVHLFASVHLDRARAEYLAEWEEVGIFESQ